MAGALLCSPFQKPKRMLYWNETEEGKSGLYMKEKLGIAVLAMAMLLWALPASAAEWPATGETALASTAETAAPGQETPEQV